MNEFYNGLIIIIALVAFVTLPIITDFFGIKTTQEIANENMIQSNIQHGIYNISNIKNISLIDMINTDMKYKIISIEFNEPIHNISTIWITAYVAEHGTYNTKFSSYDNMVFFANMIKENFQHKLTHELTDQDTFKQFQIEEENYVWNDHFYIYQYTIIVDQNKYIKNPYQSNILSSIYKTIRHSDFKKISCDQNNECTYVYCLTPKCSIGCNTPRCKVY